MLPAPKRAAQSAKEAILTTKGPSRKVFSLKTGAEPGFSREADAELRQALEGQDVDVGETSYEDTADSTRGVASPSALGSTTISSVKSTIFKPLSVSRNASRKKKPPAGSSTFTPPIQGQARAQQLDAESSIAAPKVSLFTIGTTDRSTTDPITKTSDYQPLFSNGKTEVEHQDQSLTSTDDPTSLAANITNVYTDTSSYPQNQNSESNVLPSQSLDSIANDLNLSASARRQLLGRNHRDGAKTSSAIMNFNTDEEYAANEAFRTSGEQAQPHNPVRAIAPGKHSLKQLVNAASGQKEALEESFASGRRNKKEAGGRYGW